MANRWGSNGNSERLYFGGALKSLKARQVATVRPQRSASSKRQGSGSAPRLARWKTARRAQKGSQEPTKAPSTAKMMRRVEAISTV